MFYLRSFEQAALIATIGALAYKELVRSYPAFALFLAIKSIRSLALLSVDYHDPQYGQWWALSTPVLMTLQMLVVLEVMDKIGCHFTKIDPRTAKFAVGSCFGLGAALGAISTVVKAGSGQCPWFVAAAIKASQVVDGVTIGSLVALSFWLWLHPRLLSRNLQWHRWLLVVYMGIAPGLAFATINKSERSQRYLGDLSNWILEAAEFGCCVGWIFALNRVGEMAPEVRDGKQEPKLRQLEVAADLVEKLTRIVAVPIRGKPPQQRAKVTEWPKTHCGEDPDVQARLGGDV